MKYWNGEYWCDTCGLITDAVGCYTRNYYQIDFEERTVESECDGEPDFDPEEEEE